MTKLLTGAAGWPARDVQVQRELGEGLVARQDSEEVRVYSVYADDHEVLVLRVRLDNPGDDRVRYPTLER